MASKRKRKSKKKTVKKENETITSLVADDSEVIEGEIVEDASKSDDKELTKKDEIYRPTKLQLQYLNKAVELMSDNISEISEAVGMARQTYYDWLDKPGFIEWYLGEWDRKIKIYSSQLDVIGLKKAAKGDHKFWRDMQKIVGRMQDTRSDGKTFLQMNVNFIDGESE